MKDRRMDLAVAEVERVLESCGDGTEPLLLLAQLLCELRLWARAELVFYRLLKLEPDEWMHWNNLLVCLSEQAAAHAQVMPCLRMAVALAGQAQSQRQPSLLAPLCVTLERAKLGEALQWVAEQWQLLLPDDENAKIRLAVAFHLQKKYVEAVEVWKALGSLTELHKDHLAFLALDYMELGKYSESAQCYQRLLKLGSPALGDLHNYAIVLDLLGEAEESVKISTQALSLYPDSPLLMYKKSSDLLRLGNYRQGFSYYEKRIDLDVPSSVQYEQTLGMRDHGIPMWDGSSLEGKQIFVRHEQGHGDWLMMVRFLPRLLEMGASCVRYFSTPNLESYCRALPFDDRIIYTPIALQHEIDVYLPMMSLPNRLQITMEANINPPIAPLLKPELVVRWKQRLGKDPVVGVTWRGSDLHPATRLRNIDFSLFVDALVKPMLNKGVAVVSLQKDVTSEQEAALKALGVLTDSIGDCENWYDSAHLVSCLDALIGVDTALIHLSGNLNVPTVMLNRHALTSDWRWLTARTDSPWYPSLYIVEQQKPGQWNDVLERALKSPLIQTILGHRQSVRQSTKGK